MSHKSVLQECHLDICSFWNVFAFGFVGSILFIPGFSPATLFHVSFQRNCMCLGFTAPTAFCAGAWSAARVADSDFGTYSIRLNNIDPISCKVLIASLMPCLLCNIKYPQSIQVSLRQLEGPCSVRSVHVGAVDLLNHPTEFVAAPCPTAK